MVGSSELFQIGLGAGAKRDELEPFSSFLGYPPTLFQKLVVVQGSAKQPQSTTQSYQKLKNYLC
jgi:hypothetical protein